VIVDKEDYRQMLSQRGGEGGAIDDKAVLSTIGDNGSSRQSGGCNAAGVRRADIRHDRYLRSFASSGSLDHLAGQMSPASLRRLIEIIDISGQTLIRQCFPDLAS
jgi:hypothetical protein